MATETHKVHHLDAATGIVTEREATQEEIDAMPVATGNEQTPRETKQ